MQNIHIAAQYGQIDALAKELQLVDVNTPDAAGYTALHWGCQEGHLEIVKTLISNGADMEKPDREGFRALEIACTKGHVEIVKYLLASGVNVHQERDGFTALHAAAASCRVEVATLLIAANSDVNKKDEAGRGRTPLHWAAQEGCIDLIRVLIENGAEIDSMEAD